MVLFDEIEKAHPDVLNVLLQILDDGEITDAHGRKVNFENTIIVMTSNAGSATKEGTVGFDRTVNEQDADRAMKALQQFLRPEFINRVDAVITFNRLSEGEFQVHCPYHAGRTGNLFEGEGHRLLPTTTHWWSC